MAKTATKKFVKGDPIEKLPQEKKKNGYFYYLVKRSENVAMYKQVCPDTPEDIGNGYEVFKIQVSNPVILVDKRNNKEYDYPAKEKFPGDGDFGKSAWAFSSLEEADKKYNLIEVA